MRILIAESQGFSAEGAELLRQVGDLVLGDLGRSELLQAVGQADVLWVRLRHRIDAEVLAAAPHLQILVSPTTGVNHIDIEETQRRGILLLSLDTEMERLKDVRATAEHTLALILTLLRRIPAALSHVRQGGWDRDLFRGHEIFGKTVGVVGYGRLGRIVARYLTALEARVLVADPHVARAGAEPGHLLMPLAEVLRQADIVTLHVAYSSATRGLFGEREFSLMKTGSWFINTSRGELIDEAALVAALEAGQLRGAALDVLTDEQSVMLTDRPLFRYARRHDTLVLTPHIGGCTVESMAKTELLMTRQLIEVLAERASQQVS